jgi:SAM-dependent methyltransferase
VIRYVLGTGNSGQFYAPTGATLLDVGSGPCQDLLEAVELGHESVGLEVDRISQELGGRLGLTVISRIDELSNADSRAFDWIQLNQVIEHAIDPSQLLVELKRSINKNGRIFIATPNVDSAFRRLFGKRWIHWHVPFHQHHFSKRSLVRLLNQNGFEIQRIFFRTPTIWTVLQFKALTRSDLFLATPIENAGVKANRVTIRRVIDRGENLLVWAIACVLARVTDLLRRGDCICVIARATQ